MKRDSLAGPVRSRLKRYAGEMSAHYGVIPVEPPQGHVDIRPVARDHAKAMETLEAFRARSASEDWIMSRILPRREAISSSAIEGTFSTLDELLVVEETDEAASVQARQTYDYARALGDRIAKAREAGPSIFSLDLIQGLHRDVMRNDPGYADAPGALRSVVNWIGGGGDISRSIWNPPPPEDVGACLAAHVDYLRNEGMQQVSQSLITRFALAHAHFEAVHPFRDGNGRVGRMLITLMMAADGAPSFYLSPYIEANKGDYARALQEAQQRLRYTPLIGFFSRAIVETAQEMATTREALEGLKAKWLGRRAFRLNSASRRALDLLAHYPILTARRLGSLLDVSAPQAHAAIRQLEDAHIVTERTGYARNRVFAASEALAILNRPFGEAPPEAG